MKRGSLVVLALLFVSIFAMPAFAQPRLIAITGNQGPGGPNPDPNDERLYEINLTTFAATPIIKLPWVPDTDSIGFNPVTGLLHRMSGAESYSNNPASNGYRDNQYMQTIAINTQALTQTAIFNANSEGNQNGTFGLPAPRPNWVLPTERRTDAQTGGEFRVRGPNEYHALRDITWSSSENLFYGADEAGIFRMTADGQSTFVGDPGGLAGGAKGITFFNFGQERRLLVSERDGPNVWTIDPMTGQKVGSPLLVIDPFNPVVGIGGLLSLVEHPDGNKLWGIGQGPTAFTRTLVEIDPITGETDLLTQFNQHFADLAFVFPVGPVVHVWNVDAAGNWTTASNWTNGEPNGVGVNVAFLGAITSPRTVTLDQSRTVGNITFDNDSSYMIRGPGTLTIDNGASTATIEVLQGSHSILAPLTFVAGATVNKTGPGTLTITGPGVQMHGAGSTLTVSAGTLNLDSDAGTSAARNLTLNANSTTNLGSSQHLAALNIGAAATATVTAGGPKNVVTNALSIAGGATPTGKLDVTDNAAIVDYATGGTSPDTTIRAQIISGRGGSGLNKTWNGLGITSSTAAAAPVNSISVGYAVNGTLPLTVYQNFRGEAVDPSSVLIRMTRTGDANLDGVVNNDDVAVVGANYAPGSPKPRWDLGDFDYNGFVDNDDITLLGAFYNPAATPIPAPSLAAVPEPASVLLFVLGLGAVAAGARRKLAK